MGDRKLPARWSTLRVWRSRHRTADAKLARALEVARRASPPAGLEARILDRLELAVSGQRPSSRRALPPISPMRLPALAAALVTIAVIGAVLVRPGHRRGRPEVPVALQRPDLGQPAPANGHRDRTASVVRGPGRERRIPHPRQAHAFPGRTAPLALPPSNRLLSQASSLVSSAGVSRPRRTWDSETDLLRLNEGPLYGRQPSAPPMKVPAPLRSSMLQERAPGSVVLDDLLSLNPIRLAASNDAGVRSAAAALASEAPQTDTRLRQRVFVHATTERLADLLEWLSKATGVRMIARLEIADERVSLWAEDRTLMDVMRDLRHLHGYYWSRSKRADEYVYSLWQDAQSRAREEAELQQLALKLQREFEEDVWKHVHALKATDADLKRIAADNPYFIAQMQHPVLRNAYRLFATLMPDQQAQLLRAQTPGRGLPAGHDLLVMRMDHQPGDPYFDPPDSLAYWNPRGDIVTLHASEMTPEQRAALGAIFGAAASLLDQKGTGLKDTPLYTDRPPSEFLRARAAAAADPGTATVSFFCSGDPQWQGLHMRVEFQSGGRKWMLYSDLAVPHSSQEVYNDMLRKGSFRMWPGGQEAADRILGRPQKAKATASSGAPASPSERPDPILDAPVSVRWPLPLRELQYTLNAYEVLAALHRDVRRPFVLDDGWRPVIRRERGERAEFRVEKRPLRELLHQLFPSWEIHTSEGAIFLANPDRLRQRLNQPPPAVKELLRTRRGPFTLDEMALLARSLTPWQIVRLQGFVQPAAVDQMLAVRELLQLYGELAPAQRDALARVLPVSAMTPAQQALFLAFAQRLRPFVEPWRFQNGGLRLTVQPTASQSRDPARPIGRILFEARFQEGDVQSFELGLYPEYDLQWEGQAADLVGRPFPFPRPMHTVGTMGPLNWDPALADARLRKQPRLLLLTRPFVEPYAGLRPPPALDSWAHALAERLRDTNILVAHVTIGLTDPRPAPAEDSRLPHFLRLTDTGEGNGEPLAFSFGERGVRSLPHSPTVILVGSDEIVRAVFEGPEVWDTEAIERAARALGP